MKENYDYFLEHELQAEEQNPVMATCCDCGEPIRRNEDAYVSDDYDYYCGSCLSRKIEEMKNRWERMVEEV